MTAPETHAAYKLTDAGSYDQVTDEFEHFTEKFTLPIAKRLVELADIASGARVLDVGCGTGVLMRLAAKTVGSSGTVTGVDLSEGMLRKAGELLMQDGHSKHVSLLRCDAEALTLDNSSVDRVISLYALRHFPNPEAALREMRRVVRSGGRVTVAVGSGPRVGTGAFLAAAMRFALERTLSLIGRAPLLATNLLDGMLDDFLPQALSTHSTAWEHAHGSNRQSVPAMMRSVGFADVREAWVGQSSVIATAEEFWKLHITLSSSARKRIADAPAAARDRLHERFIQICEAQRAKDGLLLYRSGALITSGIAPAA